MNTKEFSALIEKLPPDEVRRALARIYSRLMCDEDGDYDPEGSVAADSAADFVAACNVVFDLLLSDSLSPDLQEQAHDDVCDMCMRSGVAVYSTDEDGNTICEDCDAEISNGA